MRQVSLASERQAGGSYSLTAVLRGDGALVIEGHDLGGAAVRALWGAGEYEWSLTVSAAEVPRLVAALGGDPGEDPLSLLERRTAEDPRCATLGFLQEHGIGVDFWSWTSD